MSLNLGYTTAADGVIGEVTGDIDMKNFRIKNISAPVDPHDAISYDWFIRNSETQSIIYKYLGFSSLNSKRIPDYEHGNYRGSDVLHSNSFTSSSKLYVSDISLDADTTNYDMKFKFYARLIYKDGATTDYDISSGGIELKSRPNFTVPFNDVTVRWIDIGVEVSLTSLTQTLEDVRIIEIEEFYLYTLTPSTEADFHRGRVKKNYISILSYLQSLSWSRSEDLQVVRSSQFTVG